MIKRWAGVALAVAGCGALGACNGGSKAPSGQVVATVGHQEITMRDLRAELGSFNAPDPKAMKAAESKVLENIVARDLLADEARKEKLDRTPDFAVAKERVMNNLLVQALQQKIASQVPPATKDDAQRFVEAHPDIFAQRKVFVLDVLEMPRTSDPALIKALEPLDTFDQIQALLTQRKIPFKRVESALDAVGADPKLIDAIVKLPPGKLFVLPSGQVLTVNQIKDTKVIPFTGDKSVAYAQQVVTRQRTQEAMQRRLSQLLSAGVKNVKFSKDFQPAPGPRSAPATPAAPASPPPGATASGGQ